MSKEVTKLTRTDQSQIATMNDVELQKILSRPAPKVKGVCYKDPWYQALEEHNRRVDLAYLDNEIELEKRRATLTALRLSTAHDKLDLSNVDSVLAGETASVPKRRG